MAVDSHHGLKVGFAGDVGAAADKTAERTFFNIAREAFALGHRAARLSRRSVDCRFCFNTRSLIGRVSFGSGVIRNFRLLGGVVRFFLILGILSYPKHSFTSVKMGARKFSHRPSEP